MSLQRSLFLTLFLVTTPVPALAESNDFTGPVDIGGGRKMYLECRGTGFPTVVIVPGGKASADDWTVSEPGSMNVFSEVAEFTRVCAYDRPGTPVGEAPSRSDPVPMPITVADSVADLHALVARRRHRDAFRDRRALLWRPRRPALCDDLSRRSGRDGSCRCPDRGTPGSGDA